MKFTGLFRSRVSLATFQRISRTLIEAVNFRKPEPRLVDFEVSSEQRRGRDVLDGKANGLCGRIETLVGDAAAAFVAAARKQLCRRAIVKSGETLHLLSRLIADAVDRQNCN